MDVKFGSGAFMAARADAEELARALVEVAGGAGLPTVALLTDMDEVLGATAGNALEVREAIDYLAGAAREPRLHEVTLALAASLLGQGGLRRRGRRAARSARSASGAAAERFARMVAALGGPADLLERPESTSRSRPSPARSTPQRAGVVTGMDCRAVGLVITGLGGNRARETTRSTPPSASPRSRRSAPRSAPTARWRSSTPRRGRRRRGGARAARRGHGRRRGARRAARVVAGRVASR